VGGVRARPALLSYQLSIGYTAGWKMGGRVSSFFIGAHRCWWSRPRRPPCHSFTRGIDIRYRYAGRPSTPAAPLRYPNIELFCRTPIRMTGECFGPHPTPQIRQQNLRRANFCRTSEIYQRSTRAATAEYQGAHPQSCGTEPIANSRSPEVHWSNSAARGTTVTASASALTRRAMTSYAELRR
jgi:hypothetical protein